MDYYTGLMSAVLTSLTVGYNKIMTAEPKGRSGQRASLPL